VELYDLMVYMAYKTMDELAEALANARRRVAVGERYMHYKQLYYVVKDVIIWEVTNEVAVIYQAEYDPRLTFARSLSVWLETVEIEGKTVPRFAKVPAE
jgi:hypothetical protein